MPKFTTDSKFLSHSDISDVEDTIVTIKSIEREIVGQGAQAQEKWIMYFRELKKGLALNKTNGKLLCQLFHTEEMDEWIGQKISLYVKDDVEFQGEIVSAIRVRSKLPGAPKAKTAQPEEFDIDVWVAQLANVQSVVEVFGLKRALTHAPISDEDRQALSVMSDQRMEELKAVKR